VIDVYLGKRGEFEGTTQEEHKNLRELFPPNFLGSMRNKWLLSINFVMVVVTGLGQPGPLGP
jgi:hypothetical protein